MKLVSYRQNGGVRVGAVVGDQVVHLNALLPADRQLPDDMVQLLERGESALEAARAALERFARERQVPAAIPLASCDLMSPVPRPGTILMGGRNYLRHLDELRKEGAGRGEKIITPPMPHIFAKYHNSVTAHALDYVAGYTIMNDVSARCLQAQGLLTISKGFETFCPIGPWMVASDEIPDRQNLTVRTSSMISKCARRILPRCCSPFGSSSPRCRECFRSIPAMCWPPARRQGLACITTRRSWRKWAT